MRKYIAAPMAPMKSNVTRKLPPLFWFSEAAAKTEDKD
jgi:hypothetical protein